MSVPFAVGFDFDHTLGLDNGLEVAAFYRLAANLGHPINEDDHEQRRSIQTRLGRFRSAEISLDAMVRAFVAELPGPTVPDPAQQFRALCYELVDERVTPISGAREVIATLTQCGIPTAILTNGWNPLQARKIARALAYAGPVLVSDELGIHKPDPAAFARLADILALPAGSIWYVGDNPIVDIVGAQSAGLHAVWFDWEQGSFPAGAAAPDARITNLSELLDVLPGPLVSAENFRA